jgi:hypothetical protein
LIVATDFNPLDYPIVWREPLRNAPSTWTQHIPFAFLLVDLLRPAVVVELGTQFGAAYCAFCQAVVELGLKTRCYAVDTWEGDAHTGFYGSETMRDLRAYHDPLYSEFSTLLQMRFDDALSHFEDGSIDLLHIDGYHTNEATKHDFESWLPKLSQSAVVIFHDTQEKKADFGVWRLWEEVTQQYPNFEFHHGHGLGVLVVGSKYPERITFLLESSSVQADRLREFFEYAGQKVELLRSQQQASRQQKQHFENLIALTEMREQMNDLQAQNNQLWHDMTVMRNSRMIRWVADPIWKLRHWIRAITDDDEDAESE